jgi:phage baseplate assembly protein V
MQVLRDVARRVQMMLARAVLAGVSDAGGLQVLQLRLMAEEVKDGVERVQQYGLTSVPHAGAEAVVLFAGGNRDHGIVVAIDDRRYRLRGLANGEVALYDDQGQSIVLRRDRIEVTAPRVVINSPSISMGAGDPKPLARVGDLVRVGAGSSAGDWPIVTGSDQAGAA